MKALKCNAKAKSSGGRCKQPAILGGKVCRYHGGAAPQVMRKAAERVEATKQRVLEEYSCLAFFDPRTLFDENGNLLAIDQLDEVTRRAIKSIELGYGGKPEKIRLSDKRGALDSLAKHLGMFKEQVEVKATINIADILRARRDRRLKASK